MYVVLGDIVDSREIDDRDGFRDRLTSVCETANELAGDELYAPFAILKGVDEIGGVLSSARPIYRVVDMLGEALRPHGIRLAVATGEIDVGAGTRDVSAMDGSAFHRADRILERIENERLPFGMAAGDDLLDATLADEINLLLLTKRGWTDHQRAVIEAYREAGTQSAVARAFDVSQPAVSKTLERALWPQIETIEKRLQRVLREYEP